MESISVKRIKIIAAAAFVSLGTALAVIGFQTPKAKQEISRSGLSVNVDQQIAAGKRAFMTYCSGCHGVKGDGKGPASEWMQPKPRDFTSGLFKFTSVNEGDAGRLPSDMDLFTTITRGLKGSAMPSWRLLPEETRWALVAYIKTLSTAFQEGPQGDLWELPPDPFKQANQEGDMETMAAVLARGETIYHVGIKCQQCHVSYVDQDRLTKIATAAGQKVTLSKEDLEYKVKDDDWGGQVIPPHFELDHLRSVYNIEDLARRIALGVQGTPMNPWKDQLKAPEDLWAITYYVYSKIQLRQAQILQKQGNPASMIRNFSKEGD